MGLGPRHLRGEETTWGAAAPVLDTRRARSRRQAKDQAPGATQEPCTASSKASSLVARWNAECFEKGLVGGGGAWG
ncbi:hypothetical protein AAFF_G00387450 [Aldrovandia affinis]|uniref:Uncharacterized protein n=1 Tax=Aldrovandia affinis TaxID=143900 RepID=A0AAD7SEZ4_9TELE|nr:hypothetical protein AAFF_G00387450 [Aldrovandia affinis]